MFSLVKFRFAASCLKTFSVPRIHTKLSIPKYLFDRTKSPDELLANLEPMDLERLEIIKLEHQHLLELGSDVPERPTSLYFLDLLCCSSSSQRMRSTTFHFIKEKKKENDARKKQNKVTIVKDTSLPLDTSDRIIRKLDKRLIDYYNIFRICSEIRCPESSQKILFDFTYESEMRLIDQKNLASQISLCLTANHHMKPYPFHMVLTGLKPNTNQYSYLEHTCGTKFDLSPVKDLTHLPWTISPNPYYEDYNLNDPDRPLIYLSPNANETFKPGEWDHKAIFVIGALVDKCSNIPVSYARARFRRVHCMRLPLERFIKWREGRSKSLTINCIYNILITAKQTNGDWKRALLENVPKRMILEDNVNERRYS